MGLARPAAAAGPDTARIGQLAPEFAENVAAVDSRPWTEALEAWPPAQALSAAEQHHLRVAILRERIFGATERSLRRRRR